MIGEDRLLNEIRRLAEKEETPPTCKKMDSDGAFCVSTYQSRFGSWNEAVRSAGYDPNDNISETELLNEIRRLAEKEETPPTCKKMDSDGAFCRSTYRSRFGNWWKAVVRAGLTPRHRRPLTDRQFTQMVDAAHIQPKPRWKLVALLHLFTGLPPDYVTAVTADRVTNHASGTLVTIPGTDTQSGDDWQFKLLTTWGDGQDTKLPGLLTWYLDRNERVAVDTQTSRNIIHRVARDAGVEHRTVDTQLGPAPDVTPGDLRTTGGVRMARHNAPARRIRRHLGIEHTNWDADVDDFFLWCEVHDDNFSHPDYEPTGTYLEPI